MKLLCNTSMLPPINDSTELLFKLFSFRIVWVTYITNSLEQWEAARGTLDCFPLTLSKDGGDDSGLEMLWHFFGCLDMGMNE